MKFLVDENLSPRLAAHLAQRGYDATSLRDRGGLGKKDPAVLDMALVGRVELHPGLVILPNAATEPATRLLDAIIDSMTAQEEAPASYMINRVVTADADGSIRAELLPDI
jgi:hypothetical protein